VAGWTFLKVILSSTIISIKCKVEANWFLDIPNLGLMEGSL
jgi:hypothetical protein